jgi:small subunit ribosomal protein S21
MSLEIRVHENDIEKALIVLKRRLVREGDFKKITKRRFHEKPSDRKRRKQKESRKKK